VAGLEACAFDELGDEDDMGGGDGIDVHEHVNYTIHTYTIHNHSYFHVYVHLKVPGHVPVQVHHYVRVYTGWNQNQT
jgi:hypothetical protein